MEQSSNQKFKIIGTLNNLKDEIEHLYISTYREARNKIIKQDKTKSIINGKLKNIWKYMTDEKYIRLIKKKLPLRIKLFNKINICGSKVDNQEIVVYFTFDKDKYDNVFQSGFTYEELNELMKDRY